MRSDLIAKLLQDNGAGKIGSTIFLHFMPVECKKGVLIKEPLAGMQTNNELPGFYKTRFQIIVRAPTQTEGDALVKIIQKAILMKQERSFYEPGSNAFAMKVLHCLPDSLPIRFPRLEGNEIEWSLNYQISFVIPE